MAEFSGKVLSVEYIDPEHTMLKVRYASDGKNVIYHMSTNPDSQDFKDLLAEGWDAEKIMEDTAESKRIQSEAYNTEINQAARVLAQEMLGIKALQDERDILAAEKEKLNNTVSEKEKILIGLDKEVKVKTNAVDTAFFEALWDINESKEELFKFKLWALELDEIKNGDKSVKSAIRKVNRISQGMAILDSIL